MNYKSIQSKLKYRDLTVSLSTLRADFPILDETCWENIFEFYNSQPIREKQFTYLETEDNETEDNKSNEFEALNEVLERFDKLEYLLTQHNQVQAENSRLHKIIKEQGKIIKELKERIKRLKAVKPTDDYFELLKSRLADVETYKQQTKDNFDRVRGYFEDL